MLQRTYDGGMKSYYYEMWGLFDNGNPFIMRTALQSLKESARISNQFLAYGGIIMILLSCVIAFVISRRFTKPILQLVDISDKMSGLDFNAKYTGKEKNEIGMLGSNINSLSEKLEFTISELKTANNELQKDLEKKIQIDEMRKEFLSNVSHELKTPIALIQGYAEGLKEGISEDEESKDFYCEVIMDEADKMNKMVRKLLTLNQLEFGNGMIEMERFDIVEIIKSVLNSSNILIQQKGVTVEFKNSGPIYVWADEYQIEEVVTNYISNALNHVDYEKVIRIKTEYTEKNIRVSVYNTGDPIPEEDIDKVWIKFYKVDKARTREYGGSGIGLSIVKAIMDALHKPFGVFNADGGVEFWFELEADRGNKK